jgi:hypothetical protein
MNFNNMAWSDPHQLLKFIKIIGIQVGSLEGMFQHAFDLEYYKEKVFQNIPTRLIKVI